MLRRCISIFALAGFIAGQLAVVPHAHSGYSAEEQQQHDARPHVHVGGHSHGHRHSHAGHSHSHSDEQKAPADRDHSTGPGLSLLVEHEADAVYLPTGVAMLTATKQQPMGSSASEAAAAVGPACLQMHRQASAPIRPPDTPSLHAKLFLTLRHLRI